MKIEHILLYMLYLYLGDFMTEVEKRRLQLLQDVRKKYSDRNTPPAIHPRYSSTYHTLYHESEEETMPKQGTFFLRVIIAGLIFGLVFMLDYRQEEIKNVDSQTIINVLQDDLFGQ